MKPQTFADYIAGSHQLLSMGWTSGAAFEVSAQVILDDLIRRHLSSKVGVDSGNYHVQDWGAQQRIDHWPDMREMPYPIKFLAKSGKGKGKKLVTNTADFIIDNSRYTWNVGNNSWVSKSTKYYIEIKCESRKSNDFGGVSLVEAFEADCEKLNAAAQYELTKSGTKQGVRRRYWMIMIAFSNQRIAEMRNYGWSGFQSVHGLPPMVVGISEIVN